MNNINILFLQQKHRNQILHQRIAVHNSHPWLIINDNKVWEHCYYKDNRGIQYIVFHGWVFKKNGTTVEVYNNKFFSDQSLTQWITNFEATTILSEKKQGKNYIYLYNFPEHTGWDNKNNNFVYYKRPQERLVIKDSVSLIYIINGQPIQLQSSFVKYFPTYDGSIFAFHRKYVSTFDFEEREYVYFNFLSNPLFIGIGHFQSKTNFCNIEDIDFLKEELINNEQKQYYRPIFFYNFPLAEEVYYIGKNSNKIRPVFIDDYQNREISMEVNNIKQNYIEHYSKKECYHNIRIF